jgi:hypothetical protein
MQSQDGSSVLRHKIAHGKAFGAVGLGIGSRAIFKRAQEQPFFVDAVATASGGALIPVPGGVLIRDCDGTLLGAVGVTGDTSDNDEDGGDLRHRASGPPRRARLKRYCGNTDSVAESSQGFSAHGVISRLNLVDDDSDVGRIRVDLPRHHFGYACDEPILDRLVTAFQNRHPHDRHHPAPCLDCTSAEATLRKIKL